MARTPLPLRDKLASRYRRCGIRAPRYSSVEVKNLSDFFGVFHGLLDPSKTFWFRGHSDLKFLLAPSALRYEDQEKRRRALELISDMRRYLEIKLPRPPSQDDELGWMQVAQHHGLPTRLLDWTQNAAVALFFACSKDPKVDGLVAILNPIELNEGVDRRNPRIFDYQRDGSLIAPYFRLGAKENRRGKPTIAVNPTWNTDRIALQHGVFTLHGNRYFELDKRQASSLLYVPILAEHKEPLLNELHRVGIGEMFIFPEPEHVCSHLRRNARL